MTYKEKVEALQKLDKPRQKFEENVIKKRKTAKEDAAFHKHKIKQGGAGMYIGSIATQEEYLA
jgi:hypothetical protein